MHYIYVYPLWQYGLWNFQTGGTKLERFLPKNQHTQRKLFNDLYIRQYDLKPIYCDFFSEKIKMMDFENSFEYVDSFAKTFLILYPPFENSTTHIAIINMYLKWVEIPGL